MFSCIPFRTIYSPVENSLAAERDGGCKLVPEQMCNIHCRSRDNTCKVKDIVLRAETCSLGFFRLLLCQFNIDSIESNFIDICSMKQVIFLPILKMLVTRGGVNRLLVAEYTD